MLVGHTISTCQARARQKTETREKQLLLDNVGCYTTTTPVNPLHCRLSRNTNMTEGGTLLLFSVTRQSIVCARLEDGGCWYVVSQWNDTSCMACRVSISRGPLHSCTTPVLPGCRAPITSPVPHTKTAFCTAKTSTLMACFHWLIHCIKIELLV